MTRNGATVLAIYSKKQQSRCTIWIARSSSDQRSKTINLSHPATKNEEARNEMPPKQINLRGN